MNPRNPDDVKEREIKLLTLLKKNLYGHPAMGTSPLDKHVIVNTIDDFEEDSLNDDDLDLLMPMEIDYNYSTSSILPFTVLKTLMTSAGEVVNLRFGGGGVLSDDNDDDDDDDSGQQLRQEHGDFLMSSLMGKYYSEFNLFKFYEFSFLDPLPTQNYAS